MDHSTPQKPRPEGETGGVAAPLLGVDDRFENAPPGVPGQTQRDHDEQETPEWGVEYRRHGSARVRRHTARAYRGARGEDADGRVEDGLGGVAKAREGGKLSRRVRHPASS